MGELKETVRSTLDWYAAEGFDLRTFLMSDAEEQTFAVLVVDAPVHQYPAAIVVMACIEGEHVIIEADTTDRPLEDALVRAGIPREKIILAHAGEALPGASQS